MSNASFPTTRMRRLRYNPLLREMVRENVISPDKLILPVFVRSGKKIRRPIPSMPGHFQTSVDELAVDVKEAAALGIGGLILFGIPDEKDEIGNDAMSENGIISQAIEISKDVAKDKLMIITDVCFCEYTNHGHCGVLHKTHNGQLDVDNDATLKNLVRQAVVHAKSGVDMVAPSGMIDGMVGQIRQGLDQEGFTHIPIMSYSAKYASAFYGPFREAAESSPQFGDRRTYQMDASASAAQALREIQLDINEGADIIMVKPALAYLDIIKLAKDNFNGVPIATYNVSGEYSMVKAAAEKGWIDEKAVVKESLIAMHRAGANIILTYWAKEIAKWYKERN
ncbi:MAG: porphobilinogen synthase [Planctomycetaceae bacterium]|jgi:porphobilinogen synthase|nr:porphobilinogen synthase [Planctomycetaceae bacterium]